MASKQSMLSTFIEAAPPGELSEVVNDIKCLTPDDSSLLDSQRAAFQKHNEEQFIIAKIPGSTGQEVLITPYNRLGDNRYYDAHTQTSFTFNHIDRSTSDSRSHSLESRHEDLIKSLLGAFNKHAHEHYQSFAAGVYPAESDQKIALALVANKYSPNNFWNGRWRSQYLLDPSTGSITGDVKVDVHYYEDGNVRLLTNKPMTASCSASAGGSEVVRQISILERKYQEDLNRAFTNLSEGVFKSLRRQLPVTRQKVEWDKVSGYRLGQDIGGGRSR